MKPMLLVAHRTPTTRMGCERLAAAGARVFEVDVQLDDRGRIVVSHYFPFGRYGLLQRDNWRLRWRAAARDPQLADMAALVPEPNQLLLDLKEKAADRRERLVSAIVDALPHRDRFRVCGPRAEDLDRLRAAGFRTWRTVGNARELSAVLDQQQLADDAVTIRHTLLTAEVVDRLHRIVANVVAWTVNDRARARELREHGVDGVTTDRGAVLRALAGINSG